MAKLDVNIAGLSLKNPVLTASGTFGYGLEFADLIDLNRLGGFIVKGTTLLPREGNDYPRMAETPQGMLNCVGLQNKGVEHFATEIYPQLKDLRTNVIVNVSGSDPENYAACAARVDELENIPAIELNISCPNVKAGGMAFGVTPEGAASVVKAVRQAYHKTLIVKLSPNVTNIADIARAVEAEGADSVSLINTLIGCCRDEVTLFFSTSTYCLFSRYRVGFEIGETAIRSIVKEVAAEIVGTETEGRIFIDRDRRIGIGFAANRRVARRGARRVLVEVVRHVCGSLDFALLVVGCRTAAVADGVVVEVLGEAGDWLAIFGAPRRGQLAAVVVSIAVD